MERAIPGTLEPAGAEVSVKARRSESLVFEPRLATCEVCRLVGFGTQALLNDLSFRASLGMAEKAQGRSGHSPFCSQQPAEPRCHEA